MAEIWPVIATFERPAELAEQVQRLLPQLRGAERILVVHDGYGAGSQSSSDSRVIQIHLRDRVGVDRARKLGNSFVPSDAVVCEIDDHDWAEPTLLAELRQAFAPKATRAAYCDVILTTPAQKVEQVKEKPEGEFRQHGNLGLGMRAYRKWLYDAVGGYPLEYFPANDLALMCMIEQLCGYRGIVRIPKPLVRVVVSQSGISATQRDKQQAQVNRVVEVANNGGFKLPYRLLGRKVHEAQPVRVVVPREAPSQIASEAQTVSGREAPHVLLVTEVFGIGRGGGELSMLGILARIAERGYRISALYARDAGQEPYRADWIVGRKLDDISLRERGVAASPTLREALQDLAPDVVVTEVRTGANIAAACEDLGIPMLTLVQFWHGLLQSDATGWAAISQRPIPQAARNAWGCAQLNKSAALVANSEFTAEVVEACLGRPADAVVYPPVAADQVVAVGAPPVAQRQFIMCPSVQAGKGSAIFLSLARRHPEMRFLLLAGDNRHSQEDRVIDEAKALSNVEVRTEWVQDMRSVYASTRCVFIGTQTAESFCRTAAEARANGIPLLVSDAGNLPNFVRAERAGIAIQKLASIEHWDAALMRLLAQEPPESDASFCQDHTGRFRKALDGCRRLHDVGVIQTPATGISVGVSQFVKVLGCTPIAWPPAPEDLERFPLVILPGTYLKELSARARTRLAFWWCSHAAQMDTNRHEITALCELVGEVARRQERFLAFTSRPDALAWQAGARNRSVWLPNCLDLDVEFARRERLPGRHVFIPGTYCKRKNTLSALTACALIGADVHVTARIAKNSEIEQAASRLGVRLHVHDCPKRTDVLAAASQCSAAIAVSTAETYCYAAAECVLAGSPTVYWQGIPILRGGPQTLQVADPTDVGLIASALETAIGTDGLAAVQLSAMRDLARQWNKAARTAMLEMLS